MTKNYSIFLLSACGVQVPYDLLETIRGVTNGQTPSTYQSSTAEASISFEADGEKSQLQFLQPQATFSRSPSYKANHSALANADVVFVLDCYPYSRFDAFFSSYIVQNKSISERKSNPFFVFLDVVVGEDESEAARALRYFPYVGVAPPKVELLDGLRTRLSYLNFKFEENFDVKSSEQTFVLLRGLLKDLRNNRKEVISTLSRPSHKPKLSENHDKERKEVDFPKLSRQNFKRQRSNRLRNNTSTHRTYPVAQATAEPVEPYVPQPVHSQPQSPDHNKDSFAAKTQLLQLLATIQQKIGLTTPPPTLPKLYQTTPSQPELHLNLMRLLQKTQSSVPSPSPPPMPRP